MSASFESSFSGFTTAAECPQAGLLIVHGLAEYAGRYREIATALSAHGISCFAVDLRGHEALPVHRVHVERFQDYVDDVHAVVQHIRMHNPELPLFMWGHSMGSLIITLAAAALAGPVRGVITSGLPLDSFRTRLSPLSRVFRFLSEATPRLPIPLRLKGELISTVESVQRQYESDPRIARWASVRLVVELAAACERCRAIAPSLWLPWLVMHGKDDLIAPQQGSRAFYELIGASDKTLSIHSGCRHEVHNEQPAMRELFIAAVVGWITKRAMHNESTREES